MRLTDLTKKHKNKPVSLRTRPPSAQSPSPSPPACLAPAAASPTPTTACARKSASPQPDKAHRPRCATPNCRRTTTANTSSGTTNTAASPATKASTGPTPSSENLRDVLRQAIAAKTGNSRLYTYPLAENNRPEVLIDLQIRELIADLPHQRFLISAQWQVSHAGSDAAPTNHEYQQQLPLAKTDPDSLVAATAQAVKQLASAIARSL